MAKLEELRVFFVDGVPLVSRKKYKSRYPAFWEAMGAVLVPLYGCDKRLLHGKTVKEIIDNVNIREWQKKELKDTAENFETLSKQARRAHKKRKHDWEKKPVIASRESEINEHILRNIERRCPKFVWKEDGMVWILYRTKKGFALKAPAKYFSYDPWWLFVRNLGALCLKLTLPHGFFMKAFEDGFITEDELVDAMKYLL